MDAINTHGPDALVFEVLLECDNELLDDFEKRMVLQYRSLSPDGYNLTRGGSSGKKSESAKLAITNGLLERNKTYVYKRTNTNSQLTSKKYITAYTGKDGSRGFRYRPLKGDNKIITSKTRSIEAMMQEMLDYVDKVENGEQVQINKHEINEPGVQKITIKGVDKGYRYVWMENGKERAKTWQNSKLSIEEKRKIANDYSISQQNAVQRLNDERLLLLHLCDVYSEEA